MRDDVEDVLKRFRDGGLSLDEAVAQVQGTYALDLEHSTLDLDRARRNGAGEVVYGAGKTPEQVADIVAALSERGEDVLATRVTQAHVETVRSRVPDAAFDAESSTLVVKRNAGELSDGVIAVVSAGTSDSAVAAEAAATCAFYDQRLMRISDVGVAGLHRLLARLDDLRSASVLIVVAGMEGALPSAVGGLVDRPVIAVPTSVGYGANFGGLAALLGMLNSCASGVSVVNIDNGFGAGYLATMINRQTGRSDA